MGLEPVTSCLASRSRGWNEIETEEEASDLIAVRFWSESLSLTHCFCLDSGAAAAFRTSSANNAAEEDGEISCREDLVLRSMPTQSC